MKTTLITVIGFLFALTTSAQKRFDVFNVTGNYNMASTDSLSNNESALSANLSIPIVLKDSSVWFTSFDYQYYSIGNTPSETAPINKFNVHGFILRTGYILRLNSSQSIQALVIPRIMTDFRASTQKAFQLGGILMYEKKKNENLTWRTGIYYNNEAFGTLIVPLLYLDWNATKKLKVQGLFPIYGKVFVQPKPQLSYGVHFVGLTTSYSINEDQVDNHYVERNAIDLSLFANQKFFGNVFLEGRIGYSITKDYGLYAQGDKLDLALPLVNIGDDRNRLNTVSGSTTPFVHLRLIYSVPIE